MIMQNIATNALKKPVQNDLLNTLGMAASKKETPDNYLNHISTNTYLSMEE